MSITRLQQARQMYAMGQRVGRIAFGGGGSYVSGGGSGQYQGGSAAPGSAEAAPSGGGSSYSSPSDHNETYGNDSTATDPGGYVSKNNPTGTLTGEDYDKAEEDYLTGVGITGLETLYNKGVPKINAPFNLPSPFTTALNIAKPIRDYTLKKNIDYFKGLSQTKYPQTLQGYKDYMKNRLAGYTDAAGNTHPNYYMDSQGNYISADGGSRGIMEVADQTDGGIDDGTDDTTDDTTTDDELILRFLGADSTLDPAAAGLANTDELRAMLLERARNLYT